MVGVGVGGGGWGVAAAQGAANHRGRKAAIDPRGCNGVHLRVATTLHTSTRTSTHLHQPSKEALLTDLALYIAGTENAATADNNRRRHRRRLQCLSFAMPLGSPQPGYVGLGYCSGLGLSEYKLRNCI